LIYLVLTIVLVKGFGVSSNIGDLQSTIEEVFNGNAAELFTSVTLFGVLLTNSSSVPNEVAGAYQSILLITTSLVLIWALRHTLVSKKVRIRIRDAFYKSPTPFIPFLIVLIVIGLQLIPMAAANFIYSVVINGGLAVTIIEKCLWITLVVLLVILSFYMVSSSIFALYIVTLPDMTPMHALRSAREIVKYRRLAIMRKILFLPVALLVLAACIIVPIIIISPAIAEWLFFVLSMLVLAIVHSYMYHLYRELL
jgi:hypothetical protein